MGRGERCGWWHSFMLGPAPLPSTCPLLPTRPPLACPPARPALPLAALDRALAAYRDRPEEWKALRGRIMADAARWSWDTAAGNYVELYDQVSRM